ncbi:MAG: hypothetical protein A2Z04_01035, partial [Chloroflexi bacterium RBG_16_57_9]
MNTFVEAQAFADGDMAASALAQVEAQFRASEARFSRFDPTSELSRLNQATGRPFRASPELFVLVAEALQAAAVSGGLFNPGILSALELAGYDRSFEQLDRREVTGPGTAISANERDTPIPELPDLMRIRLDAQSRTIHLPAGLRLDLGGIAKGWTVDRAVALLADLGPCMVNAGGDLCAWGAPPGQSHWRIGIPDPWRPERDVAILRVRDKALATSGINRRRWRHNGREQHHLIDPHRGVPATSDLVTVTVIASTATQAEVLAKVAFL